MNKGGANKHCSKRREDDTERMPQSQNRGAFGNCEDPTTSTFTLLVAIMEEGYHKIHKDMRYLSNDQEQYSKAKATFATVTHTNFKMTANHNRSCHGLTRI